MYLASAYFGVVIIDEAGALDLYHGCCILGLSQGLGGVLMGDPMQGRHPSKTLADAHVHEVQKFKSAVTDVSIE